LGKKRGRHIRRLGGEKRERASQQRGGNASLFLFSQREPFQHRGPMDSVKEKNKMRIQPRGEKKGWEEISSWRFVDTGKA